MYHPAGWFQNLLYSVSSPVVGYEDPIAHIPDGQYSYKTLNTLASLSSIEEVECSWPLFCWSGLIGALVTRLPRPPTLPSCSPTLILQNGAYLATNQDNYIGGERIPNSFTRSASTALLLAERMEGVYENGGNGKE